MSSPRRSGWSGSGGRAARWPSRSGADLQRAPESRRGLERLADRALVQRGPRDEIVRPLDLRLGDAVEDASSASRQANEPRAPVGRIVGELDDPVVLQDVD